MNKEFVPYNEALELKQLGFNEPCFGRFDGRGKNKGKIWYEMPNTGQDSIPVGDVLAPTYSQCFRFFRDNHGLYQSIEFNERYGKWISRWCHINGSMGAISTHIKYEDAEDACLNKFIELVKTKQ